jgi:hypothetical protein
VLEWESEPPDAATVTLVLPVAAAVDAAISTEAVVWLAGIVKVLEGVTVIPAGKF